MKFNIKNKYFCWGLTAFLVLISAITFYHFLSNGADVKENVSKITNILMPIMLGMAIAYILSPVLNWLEKKIFYPLCDLLKFKESKRRNKIIRGIGILSTVFLFIGIVYLLIYMLVSQIVPSVQNIVMNYDTYVTNITKWINKVMDDNPETSSYLVNTVTKYSNELDGWFKGFLPNTLDVIKSVSLSVIGFLGSFWDFIIGFIISIYLLATKEVFAGQAKKGLYAFFERESANSIIRNLRFTHNTFIGFLSGKILDSIIIGILCFIGTSILRLPYAALVSVIIGVTNIIPFFGPFLGAIPSTILIFIVDPMHPLNCVYFVLFVLFLQQVDGNIIGPKILGSSTGLTGFWVIFAITLFGGLFGVPGMIIGVPLFAVIYAGIRAVFNKKLIKKNLPIESKQYEKLAYIDDEGLHEIENIPKKKRMKKEKDNEISNTESK